MYYEVMDYYTPESEHIAPLNASGKKQRLIQLDSDAMRDLFAKHIYDNPFAGFRELYANAVRACLYAKKKYGANPYIDITINPNNLDFTLMEYDSTGITHKIFDEIFTVLGRSSNFDGGLPGQFGIGLAAHYALSENIVIQSRARNEDELSYIIRGMKTCDDILDSNPVEFKTYGTKINLKMQKLSEKEKYDQSISNWHLLEEVVEYLRLISRFAGVTTNLIIEGELTDYWKGPAGRNKIGPVNVTDLISLEKPENAKNAVLEISNDDFDLTACNLILPKFKSVTLVGMPIPNAVSKLNLNMFNRFHINVKNERDYPPIASRDNFTDAAISALNVKIKSALVKWLMKYAKVTTMERYLKLSETTRECISTIFLTIRDEMTAELGKLYNLEKTMNLTCRTYENGNFGDNGERLEFWRIMERHESKNICCLEKYDRMKIKSLSDYIVIVPPSQKFRKIAEYVQDGSDIETKKKIIKAYSTSFDDFEDSKIKLVNYEDLDDNYIRVKSKASAYAKKLNNHRYGYSRFFFFNGTEGGKPIKDFLAEIFNKEYDGKKGADIVNESKKYHVISSDTNISDNGALDGRDDVVRLDDDEYAILNIALILLNNRTLNMKSAEEMCLILGSKYGNNVEFYNHDMLPKILKSLDKIEDKELRYCLARFYSIMCNIHLKIHHVERLMKSMDSHLKGAMQKKTTFDKVLYMALRVNEINGTPEAWGKILHAMGKTEAKAGSITRILGGTDGSYIENAYSTILTYVVSGSAVIGDNKMRNLQNLGLIRFIERVQINEDSTARVWIRC